jgi:hypothetical protein
VRSHLAELGQLRSRCGCGQGPGGGLGSLAYGVMGPSRSRCG